MGGLAGIVHFDDRPVQRTCIEGMLQAVRHRGRDGLHLEVRGSIGLGSARFVLHDFERLKTQPVWLPDGSCGLVADARLYNRHDLLAALGDVPWFGGSPTDAQIVLAAYERWDIGCVQRLRGDFAFAIWDGHRRRLFAARDPFGIKPFFYLADARRICFGSEVGQLLTVPGFQPRPNDSAIAELLLTGIGVANETTFYEGVMRLLPGHSLEADAGDVQTSRWWSPAPRTTSAAALRPSQYAEEFYDLFQASVGRRLAIDRPVALELSGGYDSSSVVVAASELGANGSIKLPGIITISQRYPEFSCDESEFIDAVRAVSAFPGLDFDAPVCDYTRYIEMQLQQSHAPNPDITCERRAVGAKHLAAEGCRVALTGLGGDELAWDPDYEFDLWRTGRYIAAVRYCLFDPRVRRERAQLERLVRLARVFTPRWLKSTIRRFIRRDAPDIPPWVAAGAAALSLDGKASVTQEARFPSHSQTSIWDWLGSPGFRWLLESEERLASRHGIELRHPFLDQDLVEFVLSIPWSARHEQVGIFKTLLVAAMNERLPAVLRDRNRKSTFGEYLSRIQDRGQDGLEAMLFSGTRWASERFVDRQALMRALACLRTNPGSDWNVRQRLWIASMVELWLRDLPANGSAPLRLAASPEIRGCT